MALAATLVGAGAAAQPLKLGLDLLKVRAHLLDLGLDRSALRLLAVEQHEEAVLLAAHPAGVAFLAVDFGLLFGLGLFVLAELVGAGGIGAAAVEGLELGFKAGAHRIWLRLRWLLLRARFAQHREHGRGGYQNLQ